MNPKNKCFYANKYLILIMAAVIMSVSENSNAQIYLDSTAAIDSRVNDLLSRMTLDEKIGQMIQMNYPDLPSTADITNYYLGSLLAAADNGPAGRTPQAWADIYDTLQSYALQTRLKIPMAFALDAIHGFGAMYGATVFPHNIGLGCTRDTGLVRQAAQTTAQEMAATGIDWTFGPVVAVARNERWGRTYESFGEDPNLVSEMSAAAVHGFQGDTSAKNANILACAKHFVGDGGTTNGVTNGNTLVDDATLRAIHLPGYISAIEQNVGSIMVAQNQLNSVHCHGSHYLLTDLLKGELGFKGIVISDWNSFLYAGDSTVAFPSNILYGAAIKNSINAGMDMAMMSNYVIYNHRSFIDTLKTLIGQGAVTIDRIDDAVKRILAQKFRLGLFERPFADRSLLSQVGSLDHRQVARECVRKSLVVLKKKDGILPISKDIKRIHLAGRHADNMGYQCGGWTITWQGSSGDITPGTTVREAIQEAAPGAIITYSADGNGADSADIGIAVIGETPYAEGIGDGRTNLDLVDIEAVRNLKSSGIPVLVILISGRPLILNPILHNCDALVAAWLPGTEGEGIADVLFGDYPPVGTLSQSWPRDVSQIPINIGDAVYNPLFQYGYGITSLDDSPAGSSPEVYSANVATVQSIEISFNKKMDAPPIAPAGFSVFANGSTPLNITGVSLHSDSTAYIIDLADSVRKTNTYTISYSPGSIQSQDLGQLIDFENVPVYNLLSDYQYVHSAPNKIEAEEYIRMKGITTVTCTDAGGGKALSSIQATDWTEYYVNVSQSGIYSLEYRIASVTDTGRIELIAKGISVSVFTLPNTGSLSAWQTASTIVQLSEGPQTIRMYAAVGGFQLNWMRLSFPTGVSNNDEGIVREFQLSQNYPNPFNPSTTITYQVPTTSRVVLKIFDILGREVVTLLNEEKSPGRYDAHWDASSLPSGVYFYRLQARQMSGGESGTFTVTRKLLLLK